MPRLSMQWITRQAHIFDVGGQMPQCDAAGQGLCLHECFAMSGKIWRISSDEQ
jgi:hypothetical protein